MKCKIIKEQNYSDSIFIYIPNILTNNEQVYLLNWLDSQHNFKANPKYTNKGYSRFQKWFQIDKRFFCEKWSKHPAIWNSFEYNQTLLTLQNHIVKIVKKLNLEKYGVKIPNINSCLINKYRDGNDYIKPHRDTDLSFGKEPTIIGLSLGESRDIVFKRVTYNGINNPLSPHDKINKHLNFKYTLESGSLFIMAGSSQRFFSHEIPIMKNVKGCRYSFTFRELIF